MSVVSRQDHKFQWLAINLSLNLYTFMCVEVVAAYLYLLFYFTPPLVMVMVAKISIPRAVQLFVCQDFLIDQGGGGRRSNSKSPGHQLQIEKIHTQVLGQEPFGGFLLLAVRYNVRQLPYKIPIKN